MANAGTAVFEAVGRFGPLIRDAQSAEKALKGTRTAAESVGKGMPEDGGTAARGVKSISTRAGELSQQMDKTGKKMSLAITAPVVLGGAKAIKTFADFDVTITQAGLKADASKEQLAKMRDVAIDMGAKTKFNAQESADALDGLAAAGFGAQDAMDALPGVMLAAQAANEDLGLTTDVVARSINTFGLQAKDAGHVADVLSQAANTTSLNMQDLQDGLANAGEVGPRFGQSMENVVGWLGRLRDMGVPAASAGVAIRQALTSLAVPSNKATTVLKDLNIETRDMHGNMLPLPDLLKNVEKGLSASNPGMKQYGKLVGMSDAQLKAWAKSSGTNMTQAKELRTAVTKGGSAMKDYALKTVFGVEGAKAFSLALSSGKPVVLDTVKDAGKLKALQEGLAKTMGGPAAAAWIKARTANGKFTASGADTVRALGAMGKASDGTAKKFGDAFNKTTAAKIDNMKGSFQNLAIVGIGAIAEPLKTVVDGLTVFASKLGDFAKAHPEITKVALAFLLVLAVMGPVLVIMAKVINAAKIVGGAFRTVSGAMGLLGKGGGASRLAGMWDTIRLKAMYGRDAIVNGAKSIGSAIGRMAASFGRGVAAAARWAGQMVAQAARAVASMVAAGVRIAAQWALMAARAVASAGRMALAWMIGIIRQAAVAAASMAVTVARVVAGWVLMGVQSLIQAARMAAAWIIAMGPIGWIIVAVVALVALIITHWSTVKAWTIAAWTAVVGFLKTAWEWIKSAVGAGIAFVVNIVRIHMMVLHAIWSAVWNAIRAAAMAVWNGIKAVVRFGIALVVGYVRLYMAILRAVWTAVWNTIKAVVQTVWSVIKGVVQAGIAVVKGVVAAGLALIHGDWQGAWDALKGVVSSVMSIIEGIVGGAIDRIKGVLSSIGDAIGKVGSAAKNLGGKIGSGVKAILPGMKTGGLVPGTGSGDKVPRMLEPGEFVLTKDAVKRIGVPVLQGANRASGGGDTFRAPTMAGLLQGSESGKVASVRAMTGVAAGVPTAAPSVPVPGPGSKKTEFNTTIVNPAPEPASDSLSRTYSKIAYLGLDAEDH